MAKDPPPIEGSRFLGSGPVEWKWLLPWACHSCHRFGEIQVNVEPTKRSNDDDVDGRIDRAHYDASPFCINRRFQRGTLVYRRKKRGDKVYLQLPGQTADQVKGETWPPWSE